ncbi:hypothetical protein GQ54DRAFT_299068 [Martensiomyces pterosporus]|nr:hypothetical protein GQ54DRAFT_299068 [Martensiomyces pterosporus]
MSVSKQDYIAEYKWLVSDLVIKDKEMEAAYVRAWLMDTKETFNSFEVPDSVRVSLALLGIPWLKDNRFAAWCMDNKRDKEDWGALEEFLTADYTNAAFRFDAFVRWKNLAPPKSSKELDSFVERFKPLAEMAGMKLDCKFVAMQFIIKMPLELQSRALAAPDNSAIFNLDSAIAQARSHFYIMEMEMQRR